jgi:uncharacterized protein
MENNNKTTRLGIIIGLILSLGIMAGGFFIGKGLYASRTAIPYITVKGLAERVVRADLAVWTITYSVVGNDITQTNNELLRQQLLVLNFVKNQGFSQNEISLDQIKLVDRYTNDYQANNKPEQRYLMKGVVRVRSNDVEHVKQAAQLTGELIKQGIVIGADTDDVNPVYYFTQLNAIRPTMLSAATASAYKVAAQFANDVGGKLGKIRRASQGIFEITSPDATIVDSNNAWQMVRIEQGSILKKIRLVSTIDYYLN